MPRARDYCALLLPHPPGQHRTAKSIADSRKRKQDARRTAGTNASLAVQRWNRTYRLKQYGLTEEDFARLLAAQDYARALCFEPFEDGQHIHIDHDHNCCGEKRACDRCRRGLLCRDCNTALGHIERKGSLARVYMAKTKTPRPRRSEGPCREAG